MVIDKSTHHHVTVYGCLLKGHDVLRECACLVAEDMLYLNNRIISYVSWYLI